MGRVQFLLALVGVIGATGGSAANSFNIKIIANSSIKSDTVSLRELKRVYLRKASSLADGTHIEPVLEKRGLAHATFLRQCLDQDSDQLQTYYRSLLFSGRASMPKEVGSDAEMVAYVARTKDAIGYVSADTNTAAVKTLYLETATERKLVTRIEPEYPALLRAKNIGGIVRLQITIAASGVVQDVRVLGGNPILADAAKAAVARWIYAPGRSLTTTEVIIPFGGSH